MDEPTAPPCPKARRCQERTRKAPFADDVDA
jgi:hypothetical protein